MSKQTEALEAANLIQQRRMIMGGFLSTLIVTTKPIMDVVTTMLGPNSKPPFFIPLARKNSAPLNYLAVEEGRIVEKVRFDGPKVNITESIAYIDTYPEFRVTLLNELTGNMILVINDQLVKKGFSGKQTAISEEVKFLWHLRNAVAHGYKFLFFKDTLRELQQSPVIFKGITISPELHETEFSLYGKNIFMGAGDLWDLLEVIEGQLRAIANNP